MLAFSLSLLSPYVPSGCQSKGTAAIAFQDLDADTVMLLNSKNLVATFSLKPIGLPQIQILALLWSAIESVDGLVNADNVPPNTDFPVNSTNVDKYLTDVVSKWKNALVFLHAVYDSLEKYFSSVGYIPILVGFGKDYSSLETAATSNMELSNFFGASYVADYSKSNDPVTEFTKQRSNGINLEDAAVVVKTANLLRINFGFSFVPLSQCIGISF
ncbi:hypothetical protein BCR33DRAFT_717408 [Rhizoclosmatium globosum]|uniref:Uncharacterized protein n=1 Tax=Rhizoclosmatium globosum TaxID=329046 RepID=A0A1Y2C9Q1_9FUNG|nr:hypothetical protein BCR33DRAFT_717408 [Rhizoclosmatium globosum]|eukprot:ORY43762.1 hypothetical protein BCR33DRAFT_717408 [Rhizoclosmatium globosum]